MSVFESDAHLSSSQVGVIQNSNSRQQYPPPIAARCDRQHPPPSCWSKKKAFIAPPPAMNAIFLSSSQFNAYDKYILRLLSQ